MRRHRTSTLGTNKAGLCVKSLLIAIVLLSSLSLPSLGQQVPSSKVVFVRPFRLYGWVAGYNLFTGEHRKVGRIRPKTTMVVDMPAGETEFYAQTEVRRSVDLNLQAGNIYFVQCSITPGILTVRPKMKVIGLTKFRQLYDQKAHIRKQLQEQGYNSVDELVKGYQVPLASN